MIASKNASHVCIYYILDIYIYMYLAPQQTSRADGFFECKHGENRVPRVLPHANEMARTCDMRVVCYPRLAHNMG